MTRLFAATHSADISEVDIGRFGQRASRIARRTTRPPPIATSLMRLSELLNRHLFPHIDGCYRPLRRIDLTPGRRHCIALECHCLDAGSTLKPR